MFSILKFNYLFCLILLLAVHLAVAHVYKSTDNSAIDETGGNFECDIIEEDDILIKKYCRCVHYKTCIGKDRVVLAEG